MDRTVEFPGRDGSGCVPRHTGRVRRLLTGVTILGLWVGACSQSDGTDVGGVDESASDGSAIGTAEADEPVADLEAVAADGAHDEGIDEEPVDTLGESVDDEQASEPRQRCVVRLHGKGGDGGDTGDAGGFLNVFPAGNGEAWGGREWRYETAARYTEALESIVQATDAAGCTEVVVNGFSNGGAMAAKLFCAGEDLGGRVLGVVVDDPVTDASADACTPAAGVQVALYWTGRLPGWGSPGTECEAIDWTCEGPVVISVDDYAENLGTAVLASVFSDHQWFFDAPEIVEFFG